MANSFFGFDPTKPPDQGHNSRAPGFGPTPNAFASFDDVDEGNGETFDFDADLNNDNLGSQLEETGDEDNDATFGVGAVDSNFDFSGHGFAQQQQPARQARQQPQPQPQPPVPQYQSLRQETSRPTRTGYESYKQPGGRMPDLAPSASIWGAPSPAPKQEQRPQQQQHHQQQQPSLSTATRKMMSLDEVEAMMRSQKKPTPQPPQQPAHPMPSVAPPSAPQDFQQFQQQPQELQAAIPPQRVQPMPGQQIPLPFHNRDSSQSQVPTGPTHILRRPAQQPAQTSRGNAHNRGPSLGGRPVTHPDQITQLSEQQRAEFLAEEAHRAKRNHKIQQLARDNGLMTPQDKNFILRIQLQQLVTATGGTDERGPEAMLAEDFYYQVFSQIRGAPANAPAGNFAQAYMNQLSWQRGGGPGSRRYPRGGENHMRRMEQQVQRAVEAAKARPKNKQLVVEGSLGKISFSNSKTPKPLLNLKRADGSEPGPPSPRARTEGSNAATPAASRKQTLRDIEACYAALMSMEDHERSMPPPPREESSADEIQGFMDWRAQLAALNASLWRALRIAEPFRAGVAHPFTTLLAHPKGKKLIPRVFRQIDDNQRLTVLTMLVAQADMLDVIRAAQPPPDGTELPAAIRAELDLYAQAVEPSLFAYIADAPLPIVIGLVGIATDRVDTALVIRARPGVNLLTRLISRAVLLLQAPQPPDAGDAAQWTATFTRLFDALEPLLPLAFASPIAAPVDADFFVWQFLAALGIAADQDQQQRLVLAVKDRVMDSVSHAKSVGGPEERERLDKVNLFMRAIGLDVDLLG